MRLCKYILIDEGRRGRKPGYIHEMGSHDLKSCEVKCQRNRFPLFNATINSYDTIASLYKLYKLPIIADYFLLFDDLLKVVYNTSVKHKFSSKVLYKDKKRAWYKCNNKDCP
jgi:hypothetical protein